MAVQAQGGAMPGDGKSNPLFASSLLDTGGSQSSAAAAAGGPAGDRRSNPLFDSQASSASRKSARTTSESETASSKFRSLFSRKKRTETS